MSDVIDCAFDEEDGPEPLPRIGDIESSESSSTDERREVQTLVHTTHDRGYTFYVRVSSYRRVPEPWTPPTLSVSCSSSSSFVCSESEFILVGTAVITCFRAFREKWTDHPADPVVILREGSPGSGRFA